MKKWTLTLMLFALVNAIKAEEGMWLPMLLKQWNEADMQNKGFKLTAEDIYSVNNSSMKDAVVWFNGGCTAELVSDKGLLITNHHCGYSAIQALSSMDNNLLMNGFWAHSMDKELPCPGLYVTFIIRIEDVTSQIIPYLNDTMSEPQREAKIKQLSAAIEKEAVKGTSYGASVKPFYYGNEFCLFVTETFNDIRLTGAPPEAVGNFGGETDNWIWPRHTGDFSIFRIYANNENKPAAYSADNVPYKPKYFFPISTRGVNEGDFTLVYGFPGRTQEYLPSVAVDFIVNQVNPARVHIRDKRLEQMHAGMNSNDTIMLKYAAKARSLANAYKKWKGEMIGIQQTNAVEQKRTYEKKMLHWIQGDKAREKKYGSIFHDFKKLYDEYKPLATIQDYTIEAANAVELLGLAGSFNKLMELATSDTTSQQTWKDACNARATAVKAFFRNYDHGLDRSVFVQMMILYRDNIAPGMQPLKVKQWKDNASITVYADRLYAKSMFVNEKKLLTLLADGNRKKVARLAKDEAFELYSAVNTNYAPYYLKISQVQAELQRLMRIYMNALRDYDKSRKFYPDANSTLRVAYGNVREYQPRNGVTYNFSTTASGIREKNNSMDEDFAAPAKLLALIDSKDYGRYAVNGELPTAFIATNHTTGGNSGSPVLNANGELIGTNYDRVWEGTMSDLNYDISRCRNIVLDIRYTLFIIDKFAGATNLINEMKIVN